MWFSHTDDHRGQLIADIIQNSTHISLNTDTPTRKPTNNNQQQTSPDITTTADHTYRNTTWTTLNELTSDHLPIIITLNTKTNYKLHQNKATYTNYNKADWQSFTQEIEEALQDTPITDNVHTANKILTNIILSADKHHIPKGKIHNKSKLLPDHIRVLIEQRNALRTQDPTHPDLEQMNANIDNHIQTHKTDLWKEHLDKDWSHKHDTHVLWKTVAGLSNK